MSHSAYPVKTDISTFLNSIEGITVPSGYDCQKAIDAAIAEIERVTEYSPFLSTGATAARPYDPPGPYTPRPRRGGGRTLRLGAGLISCASVTIGTDNASTQQVLTVNEDFYLWPSNAPYHAVPRPYTAIEFFAVQWGYPRSISVNGVWGFSTTLPDDVWQAAIYLASSYVVTDFLEGIFNSPSSVKDDDVTITQDFDTNLGVAWSKKAHDTLHAYTLIS